MPPKKVVIIASSTNSLINFRLDLLTYLNDKGMEVYALGPDKKDKAIEILEKNKIQFYLYPLQRNGFNPMVDLKTIKFLRKKFKEIQPDVILPYTAKPVLYSNIAKRGLNIKSVSWITGLGFYGLPSNNRKDKITKNIMTYLYKVGLEEKDFLVFQNKDDVDFFKNKGILKNNSTYRITPGSGVNLTEFPYSDPPIHPIQFIYVGRLIKAKGINVFAEAATKIKEKYNEKVNFVALGLIPKKYNPDALSEAQFNELKNKNIVDFRGVVRNVPDHLKESSVFVLPSTYREGIPRSILEALSIGRAIITTDNVGCRETVKKDYNGILINKNDTNSLIQAMSHFCDNPNKIIEYGRNSRQLAEKKFDINIVNKIMLNIIQK